jgi:hypothetical protein
MDLLCGFMLKFVKCLKQDEKKNLALFLSQLTASLKWSRLEAAK